MKYHRRKSVILVLLSVLPVATLLAQSSSIAPKERRVIEAPKTKAKFHIFLLAGQSNMAGRGFVEPIDTIGDPRILRLNRDGEWETAKDPIHFDKDVAGVGPGLSFAKELLKKDSSIVIGLIPCAAGGSSIDNWLYDKYWEQTQSFPWNQALIRTKLALTKGVLKGIIWHQGEADAGGDKLKAYPEKLVLLVEKFRKVFRLSSLPFIAGELPAFNKAAPAYNAMLHDVAKQIKFFAVVPGDGLTANPDGIHIDAGSQRMFGKRYAAEWLLLQRGTAGK
ncbi:MAG: sialate O-acetylesterase [Chitinophagaceae bacterium]